jgi:hypothetical protein
VNQSSPQSYKEHYIQTDSSLIDEAKLDTYKAILLSVKDYVDENNIDIVLSSIDPI